VQQYQLNTVAVAVSRCRRSSFLSLERWRLEQFLGDAAWRLVSSIPIHHAFIVPSLDLLFAKEQEQQQQQQQQTTPGWVVAAVAVFPS
jgi:hypothetical protein